MRLYCTGLFLGLLLLASCAYRPNKLESFPALIPMPQSVVWRDSLYTPLAKPYIISLPNDEVRTLLLCQELNETLVSAGLPALDVEVGAPVSAVAIELSTDLASDAYEIHVGDECIRVLAGGEDGMGYAVQTLRQLVTPVGFPIVDIVDQPRFEYRGFMLDESRHFMGPEYVKHLLDEMQRYKFNRLHWHLVDAGGWRLEIKAYPELTGKTAYRTQSDWTKWWVERDRRYATSGTKVAYGGYYTQEQAREIVAYAAERGITVIPEVEMPGHSEEVLYAYPHLSCSGSAEAHESDFCVANEESFVFLQTVLDEVMAVFPSPYIHIGGDEAGKVAWRTCPKCQALMAEKGWSSVDQLQSYMIHRIEEYVNGRGRFIIGWDEILEGGLAPNATVMSWRGEEGGIAAARQGHDVIMVPSSHLYFDFYQENPLTAERRANGGYTTIEKVYAYDPMPAQLGADYQKHVKGVQANLWTEYVLDPEHADYMTFPRLLAVSEIAWTRSEIKDWESFRLRVNGHVDALKRRGVSTYDLTNNLSTVMSVDSINHRISVKLSSELYPADIRYTLDGTVPTPDSPLYLEDTPIVVTDSATVVAGLFRDGQLLGTGYPLRLDYHKGIGKVMTLETPIDGKYPAGGDSIALLDGWRGSITYLDGRWLGNCRGKSTIGTVDMGEEMMLSHIFTRAMHDRTPSVFMPAWVELSVSVDGKTYDVVDRVYSTTDQQDMRLRMETFHFYPNRRARYVRVHYELPDVNQYLFTDELVIW